MIIPPATFVVGILFLCPCVHASVRACVRACVRPSVTFCFFNILKSHCWIFIKPCKHVDGEGDTAPENFGTYSFIGHDRFDFFYIRRTNKGCHVHAMCKLLLF